MIAQHLRVARRRKGKIIEALIVVALTVLLSYEPLVHAQSFNCGSTRADGALNVTTPGTYDFYPGNTQLFSSPVDPEGDNIYHFTTINIASGVTLRMTGKFLNGPVFWLASGAVQIDGTINLDGGAGHLSTTILAERVPSIPGAGGYSGGVGGNLVSPPQPGLGPGGGAAGLPFGGAGSFTGNAFLVPLIGGSGGGGVRVNTSFFGAGGGAGGGALLLCSSTSIVVSGTISANGGGGDPSSNPGGGSGGAIRLVTPTLSGAGTLSVAGGAGGGVFPGGSGRIRLEAFQNTFNGGSINTSIGTLASPFALFLPTTPAPSVRVVNIDGQPVPANPTGSFTVPDVAINKSAAVTVQIAASNIPPGTVVKLYISSENAPDQTIDSLPLAGTLATSTATASVVLPPGFSRGFVRATWTTQ